MGKQRTLPVHETDSEPVVTPSVQPAPTVEPAGRAEQSLLGARLGRTGAGAGVLGGPGLVHPTGVRQRAALARTLQRRRGNAFVQRAVLQRKALDNAIPRPAPTSLAPGVQAKLAISQPGDSYEQEADRVADRVMRMPKSTAAIQQQTNSEVTPPIVSKMPQSGSSRPLDATARAFFEPRFGQDFSQVQVHTGTKAAESARSMHARAYTVGSNVVFGDRQFAPNTTEGKRLLAHELTHVVQQEKKGGAHVIQRYMECGAQSECPSREPNEVCSASNDPMIVAGVSNPNGTLVANFAIGNSRIKSDLATNPAFIRYTADMAARPQTRFEILGFSDCQGAKTINTRLRDARARALFAALPEETRGQVTAVNGAPLTNCLQSNRTARGRTMNRSAFLRETGDVHTFEDDVIEATPGALFGVTSPASEYWVRATPSKAGEKIGRLTLREMRVEIIGEHGTTIKNLWYRVRFSPGDFEIVRQRYADYMAPRMAELVPKQQEQARLQGRLQQYERRPGLRFETRPEITRIRTRLAKVGGDIQDIQQHQFRLTHPYQGPEGWVGAAAFAQVAMLYGQFLQLVDAFDKAHASESLRDRLTRLRQIGEDSSLEGDAVVGRGEDIPNRVTQTERRVDTSQWQLLLEAKQVIMPNMEVIDIHHFILGLDALALPASQQSTSRRINLFLNVGESFSATTWSGDIGGAAADYVMHRSREWEKANTAEDNRQRLEFYYRTRAQEMELLADIDAWGAFAQVPKTSEEKSSFKSLRAIFEAQYGGEGQTGAQYEQKVRSGRRNGIITFLSYYGFTSSHDLNSQRAAANRVGEQIFIFSKAWYELKSGLVTVVVGPTEPTENKLMIASYAMATMFLDWLESQARRYDVWLPGDFTE